MFDVAVDVRAGSPTFGRWVGERLSGENKRQLYIPEGFAHGFYVLSEHALLGYKCTELYHPETEISIAWTTRARSRGRSQQTTDGDPAKVKPARALRSALERLPRYEP